MALLRILFPSSLTVPRARISVFDRYGLSDRTLCNPDYVIYHDHAYVFTDGEKYPRRDNIDVLQDYLGMGLSMQSSILRRGHQNIT